MDISLTRAGAKERPILENLLQFYIYDLSDVVGADLGDGGRFGDLALAPYWEDAWRHPFLLRVAGKLAGFALVQQRSRISGDAGVWDMAEFFVMKKYRRQRAGSRTAMQLFEAHRGKWEIRQRLANTAATAFWRHVIAEFSGGKFEEISLDDDRWRGPVQSFES